MHTLHAGDSLEVLKQYPDNHFDAVVTDPPYGLGKEPDAVQMLADWIENGVHTPKSKRGFMGKEWDAFVPQPVLWAEVYRVLKPGGHVLAFAGTRTQDLMCLGLRLAGFEIRDLVAWVYGSGFPKSLDVSKAIDKRGGSAHLAEEIGQAIKAERLARGLSVSECDNIFCGGTTNWSWFEGRPKGQRAPSVETFARIVSEWPNLAPFAEAVAEVEREVVGQKVSGISNKDKGARHTIGASSSVVVDITAPCTPAAQEWSGWGTALKPALEPITLARKPLEGTVAANVLKWRTGAVNVDSCRVGVERRYNAPAGSLGNGVNMSGGTAQSGREGVNTNGRWPANLIHDGSDEVLELFPDSAGAGGSIPNVKVTGYGSGIGNGKAEYRGGEREKVNSGSGSAARFFYCAKASKKDRQEGLDESNPHPTVKPNELMRYLCRLITPPNGLILDPFMGSGSTGKAAVQEGFGFVGIDLSAEFLDISEARISAAYPPAIAAE